MELGWWDGGYGELRASDRDRDQVRRLLEIAEGEGRLDAAEYDRRLRALDTAGTRARLAALAADVPARRGERDWDDRARIRAADRDAAIAVLARGMREGRLSTREYAQRAEALPAAARYAELKQVLSGLPGWPDAPDELLAGTEDRDAALAALADAVADGRVGEMERPALDAEIAQARRRSDLERLAEQLAARVGDTRRAEVIDRLDAAYRAGQLDAREQDERVAGVRRASTPAQLARLVRDLAGDDRRPTDADRSDAMAGLARGLKTGRLTLAEYERRTAAVAKATGTVRLRRLVADLVEPPRQVRRGPLDMLFDLAVFDSALLPAPRYWVVSWLVKPLFGVLVGGFALAVLGFEALALSVGAWQVALFVVVMLFTLGGFVIVILYLLLVFLLTKAFGRGVDRRRDAILADLRSAIGKQHGVEKVRRLDVNSGSVAIELELDKAADLPAIAAESVRLLWRTRLYPLRSVHVEDRWRSDNKHELKLDRAERRRLRSLYGPRPYGPLPSLPD